VRIHYIDFGKASNRVQTARKVARLISCRNKNGDINRIGVCAARGCRSSVRQTLHVEFYSGAKTEIDKTQNLFPHERDVTCAYYRTGTEVVKAAPGVLKFMPCTESR
jgi:hypothetical protein